MPEDFFDFESLEEPENSLDYENLIECPHCKKLIAEDATLCYFCGEEVNFKKKSSGGSWAILIFIFLLTIYLILRGGRF